MVCDSFETKTVQEFCTVVDCEHKTAPYVEISDFLVVRTSNVRNGQLLMEDMKYTTKAGFEEWTQRAIPEYGDVLFTREAPAGESCLVPKDKNVCMGQRMVLLRPDRKKIDPLFLSLILATEKSKFYIFRLSIGSTVSRINIADIKNLKIATPPLQEQKKIAKILSTWDQAIEKTELLIENSKLQKKALMQQLLTGKKRLPGFKDEFTRCHLSEIAEIDRKSLSNKMANDFSFQYISLSDIEGGRVSNNLETMLFKDSPSRARRVVKNGDILLATVRPNLQNFAKIEEKHDEMIASTGFSVLTPRDGVCGNYIYHYLFSAHITGQINSLVVGSNYPAINSSDVSGLLIYCPDYSEQIAIAELLDTCDQTTNHLQLKSEYLTLEKKSLMQQLLTGKRRVKV